MRRAPATSELLRKIASCRKRRILAKLKLSSQPGKTPKRPTATRFKTRFFLAAQQDLRREAKRRFKKLVVKNDTRSVQFRERTTFREVEKRMKRRIRRRIRGRWPLIYVYLGYTPGLSGRACVYVGRTEGHRSRPSDHRKILSKYKVTQVKVFRIKTMRALAAAECLAIHGYGPLENKMKAAKRKGWTNCQICRRIKKAWKECKPLLASTSDRR